MKTYNNKYLKWYNLIIDRARNRTIEGYVEVHHIVPKSLGGTDEERNLVALTAREHLVAHMLLPRFVENKKPMWYALWCMVNANGIKVNSRLYEQARIQFRSIKISPETLAKRSAAQTGKKLSPEHIAKCEATRAANRIAKQAAGIDHPLKGKKIPPGTIAKRLATREANRIAKQAAGIDYPLKGRKGRKWSPGSIAKREATKAANRALKSLQCSSERH